MPSENSEQRRPAKPPPQMGTPTPSEHENLPCPRCNSTITKFCYYNNYNLSQPRHFCKSCRRYWTKGGTLRDVPVGGGTRKSAKRSRTSSTSSSSSSPSSSSSQEPISAPTLPIPMISISGEQPDLSFPFCGDLNLEPNLSSTGTFSSLLNNQATGFLSLSGFGLGLGSSAFDDLGRGVWPFTDVGVAASSAGSTWQLGSGGSDFVDSDCFSWPELAISMPGHGLK